MALSTPHRLVSQSLRHRDVSVRNQKGAWRPRCQPGRLVSWGRTFGHAVKAKNENLFCGGERGGGERELRTVEPTVKAPAPPTRTEVNAGAFSEQKAKNQLHRDVQRQPRSEAVPPGNTYPGAIGGQSKTTLVQRGHCQPWASRSPGGLRGTHRPPLT